MAYTITRYLADSEDIHPIRLSDDKLAQAGTPPTGVAGSPIFVKISKTNREFGIRPRGVRLVRTVGTAPNTFKKYSFLPVLTPTAFAGTGFAPGSAITIGTVAWTVAARVPEDY